LKGHHGDKIEIASVNIAYKNREIIQLLKERGTVVTAAKFDKLDEIDQKIDKCVTANFEKLTTPIYAFVMFNTQEGYERAVEYLSATTPFGFKNKKR
jgi:RNA binding exosome subunit